MGIGSGGNAYDQLLQAGTVAYSGPTPGSGTYPFFQIFPYENEQILNYAVNSGDAIGASVILGVNSSGQQYLAFAICDSQDNTCASGSQYLPITIQTNGQQGEWIMERHGFAAYRATQLLNFGSTSFQDNSYDEGTPYPAVTTDSYTLGVGPASQATSGVLLHRVNMYSCGNPNPVAPQLDSTGTIYGTTGNFGLVWINSGTPC